MASIGSSARVLETLKKYNGTPDEILNNADMMTILLPMLRNDFKIAETYKSEKSMMPFPILVLDGKEDNLIPRALMFLRYDANLV